MRRVALTSPDYDRDYSQSQFSRCSPSWVSFRPRRSGKIYLLGRNIVQMRSEKLSRIKY